MKKSKKPSMKFVLQQLKASESMAREVGAERDRMTEKYNDEKRDKQDLLNRIGAMLKSGGITRSDCVDVSVRRALMGSNDTADFGPRKVSIDEIALKVGQLILIEQEYLDLKDRCLPIPKMQVIADDRNDRRNGGRGSGLNLIGS